MYKIHNQVSNAIGNTPVVRLKTKPNSASVFVKLEGGNPGGSIKDRPAHLMVQRAEEEGFIHPLHKRKTIIECSGGSMAHGLLTAAGNRYPLLFVVPNNYSQTKINALKARGAQVRKADASKGNDAHYVEAQRLAESAPDNFYFINQLFNPANPEAHYRFTAEEILDQFGGERIDYFITGIGSGGTISGVGRRLKEVYPGVKVIGVQPAGCDVLAGAAIKHRIQGLAVGLLPGALDVNVVDEVMSVNYWDAIDTCERVNSAEGLFLGISSGANIYAAQALATKVGNAKNILTTSPDGGGYYVENYLEYYDYVKNFTL